MFRSFCWCLRPCYTIPKSPHSKNTTKSSEDLWNFSPPSKEHLWTDTLMKTTLWGKDKYNLLSRVVDLPLKNIPSRYDHRTGSKDKTKQSLEKRNGRRSDVMTAAKLKTCERSRSDKHVPRHLVSGGDGGTRRF